MNVSMQAEYYDGAGFIPNPDDSCTGIAATELVLSNTIEQGQTDAGIAVCAAGGETTMSVSNDPFAGGEGGLVFTAPGTQCRGFTDIGVDLDSLGLDYLQYDWVDDDGMDDGPYDQDPAGRATFGIISRPKAVIYTREPWN